MPAVPARGRLVGPASPEFALTFVSYTTSWDTTPACEAK